MRNGNNMYKIAICDDDVKYLKTLQEMIRQLGDRSLNVRIDLYTGGKQFVWEYQGQYDLIILDIQMPDIDGNTVAEEIRKKDVSAVLAFCTGEVQPSTDSFKVQPYRYIMKNFDNEVIREEICACLQEMVKKRRECQVVLTGDGEFRRIPATKIVCLKSCKMGL